MKIDWCVIGYQSLQAALHEYKSQDENEQSGAELNWKAFELNPGLPQEGQDLREHLQQKYGASAEQSAANRQNIKDRGADVGYEFNFAENGRIYNTFDAHRLLHWAKQFGLQTELKLAFFDLYFKHQADPSNHDSLLKYVAEVGLDSEAAKQVLDSERYADEVRTEQQQNHQNGISAVPAFIFNDKYLVSGGQPKEVFLNVFAQLEQEVQSSV